MEKPKIKNIYLSLGFAIVIICVVLFLFYKVSSLPDTAQKCMNDPLEYAESMGSSIKCYCEKATTQYGLKPSLERVIYNKWLTRH